MLKSSFYKPPGGRSGNSGRGSGNDHKGEMTDMEIRKLRENDKLTISLDGQLDTMTAKELEKELHDSVDGVTELVLDLSRLSFITSAGLRILAVAQKMMKRQGRLVIRDPQPDVREVFDVTGLSSFLEIETSYAQ